MKLQPMTEFVLQVQNRDFSTKVVWSIQYKQSLEMICNYASFLKQPLELGMFVPVDEEGKVLEEPLQEKFGWYSACSPEEESGWMYEGGEKKYYEALEQWKKAKEKVLFEGFEYVGIWGGFWDLRHISSKNFLVRRDGRSSIEKLLLRNVDLELTHSAIKQFSS